METKIISKVVCVFILFALLLVCASSKMQYAKHLTLHEQKNAPAPPPYRSKEEKTYFTSAQTQ